MLKELLLHEVRRADLYVLILILMEYAQRGVAENCKRLCRSCLNPYSNGICSKRECKPVLPFYSSVLILILMEYAQRV